jgi:hypothetical protein
MLVDETYVDSVRDVAGHIAQLGLKGHSQLAADVILRRELRGKLQAVLGEVTRRLQLEFVRNPTARDRCYETLLEIAFNLVGVEGKRIGFSDEEVKITLQNLTSALRKWEGFEKEAGNPAAARRAIRRLLDDMKGVMMGKSMVAKIAEAMGKEIDEDNLMESFILSIGKLFRGNVYYMIVTQGMSKLGNDSATGLRRVRHLGAVQVSMNPVIAARAYDEQPNLWNEFRKVTKAHPEWYNDPEKYGDELALNATVTCVLPNLLTFRQVALFSGFHDGLVSYQLNPHDGTDVEASINDATKIYTILERPLEEYDSQLMWNLEGKGRPNIVFKVPACHPAAIETTKRLNGLGIGTNNTVTYTVAQEVTLIMAAMQGMSEAVRIGVPISQAYETNMIGRLEDHLREAEAERLLQEKYRTNGETLRSLAKELGAPDVEKAGSIDEMIRIMCSKKYLKQLTDKRFVNAVKESVDSNNMSQLEEAIEHAGIFVTRRVYRIFFVPENRQKWINYLQDELGDSRQEAEEVFDKIDLLPASKRRARDTYLVLGRGGLRNLTNTEFPNQQLDVWQVSNSENFNLHDFEGSIMNEPEPDISERLLEIRDFQKAYELTPELVHKLRKIGIQGEFGNRGLEPEEWAAYGPVRKTMHEFSEAYDSFRRKVTEVMKQEAASTQSN